MKIGDCVKPLRSLKRKNSVWTYKFGKGKSYRVVGKDSIDGEELLKLETGPEDYEYMLVFPDEVKKSPKKSCDARRFK